MTKPSKRSKRKKDTPAIPNGRDASGRYLPGHGQPGPGNPDTRRLYANRRAILDATTTDDVVKVFRKLLEQALDGDTIAAKEVLLRTLGKPPSTAQDEGGMASIRLPELQSPEDLRRAFSAVLEGLGDGAITLDQATRVAGLLEMARRTIETEELAQRIQALEDDNGGQQPRRSA